MASSLITSLSAAPDVVARVPDWAQDATWYQVFVERFSNGDSSNDPTRESLEPHAGAPANWRVTPWTGAWYDQADWERQIGPHFYHNVHRRRYGGDLQGVIDKLDHLQGLGVTAIYFNPIFHAASLHKYDASSFHHIDPHFGPDPAGDLALMANETEDPATWNWTAADKLFLELLQQAKSRKMRVILDGVWNHTGVKHFAFQDVVKHQSKSRYQSWYQLKAFDLKQTDRNEFDYEGWHGFKSLPALRQEGGNLADGPKAYIFACTKRWMDPDGDGDPADGIDGWRLDVAEELPPAFWQEWHALVRQLNPQAFTSAEIWGDSKDFIINNHFSSAMNYNGFAMVAKAWFIDRTISSDEFHRQFGGRFRSHPQRQGLALMNLYDSHDTQRIASAIVNRHMPPGYDDSKSVGPQGSRDYKIQGPNAEETEMLKLMALFQFTAPGAPMIYYGTELGMWGADDPDDRMPAWWPDLEFAPMTRGPHGESLNPPITVGYNAELHAYYQRLGKMRAKLEVLRRGDFQKFDTNSDEVFAFLREDENLRALIVLNRGSTPIQAPTSRKPAFLSRAATKEGEIPAFSGAVYVTKRARKPAPPSKTSR
mgnify:CR=1 FL=1